MNSKTNFLEHNELHSTISKDLLIRGQNIKIKSADEPTSVNFENIGITKKEKYRRNCIAVCLILVLMLSFFCFMMILTLLNQFLVPSCNPETDYSQIIHKEELRSDWEYIECYCKSNILWENLTTSRGVCIKFYLLNVAILASQLVVALFVFYVNLWVRTSQKFLAKYRKFENNVNFYIKKRVKKFLYIVLVCLSQWLLHFFS